MGATAAGGLTAGVGRDWGSPSVVLAAGRVPSTLLRGAGLVGAGVAGDVTAGVGRDGCLILSACSRCDGNASWERDWGSLSVAFVSGRAFSTLICGAVARAGGTGVAVGFSAGVGRVCFRAFSSCSRRFWN